MFSGKIGRKSEFKEEMIGNTFISVHPKAWLFVNNWIKPLN